MLAVDVEVALTDRDLARIIKLVYARSGITLHDGKRALVVARLQKRLRALALPSFEAYVDHVERDRSGDEIVALLDAIATNHTYFFREEQHFDFLKRQVVPAAIAERRALRIWSAACSTGEEPYSIAITTLGAGPALDFRILASDLSTKALRGAQAGVYKLSAVEGLPREMLQRYFERGLGAQEGLARVHSDVRRHVEFRRFNLVEDESPGQMFDLIFCRNVMIYFDRAVQERVVTMLQQHLAPGGYLFVSHSESLNGIAHRLRWVAPAIYRRGERG